MHTNIPEKELEVISKLKDVKIVFDVGARTDTDYFEIFPDAEFHLFEPNPVFFKELVNKVRDKKNVYLNNFGLGDVDKILRYSDGVQSFEGSEAWTMGGDRLLPMKRLDDYVKAHDIKHIDFLKIDTEGYDYKVLKGAKKALKRTKYIQYEHWDNLKQFHNLLEPDFDLHYIGYRNVLCLNTKLIPNEELTEMAYFIADGEYRLLA